MSRTKWVILAIVVLYPAFLAMEAMHELGHVINARLSGGRVARVELPLAGFSRTDLAANPHPQFVAWGGMLWGTVLPLALAGALTLRRRRANGRVMGILGAAAAFFAGFCLVANGAYIGLGGFMSAGDGPDLIRHGAPPWLLLVAGGAALVLGLLLWHRGGRVSQ